MIKYKMNLIFITSHLKNNRKNRSKRADVFNDNKIKLWYANIR